MTFEVIKLLQAFSDVFLQLRST